MADFTYQDFFTEKLYTKIGENISKFDIQIDEFRCSEPKDGKACFSCFNDALIEKMLHEVSPRDKINFIEYQMNIREDKLGFLTELADYITMNDDYYTDKIAKSYLKAIEEIRQKTFSDNTAEPIIFHATDYVNPQRLTELKAIQNKDFDLTRLIRLCEELNVAYKYGLYYATAMLVRGIIDHIPPIFGHSNFASVSAQYGSKSFKKQMEGLDTSLRNIADSYLHSHIKKKEVLNNSTQVNFSPALDVLLAEICTKLH
jgi:hypothetical protein